MSISIDIDPVEERDVRSSNSKKDRQHNTIEQRDKQWSTRHYTENKRLNNTSKNQP